MLASTPEMGNMPEPLAELLREIRGCTLCADHLPCGPRPVLQFYDPDTVAVMSMGFCYPGKARSGDKPPRSECASHWHGALNDRLLDVRLTVLPWLAKNLWFEEDVLPIVQTAIRSLALGSAQSANTTCSTLSVDRPHHRTDTELAARSLSSPRSHAASALHALAPYTLPPVHVETAQRVAVSHPTYQT
eukprot:gene26870-32346_t